MHLFQVENTACKAVGKLCGMVESVSGAKLGLNQKNKIQDLLIF